MVLTFSYWNSSAPASIQLPSGLLVLPLRWLLVHQGRHALHEILTGYGHGLVRDFQGYHVLQRGHVDAVVENKLKTSRFYNHLGHEAHVLRDLGG